jgi:hypothetical protein
VGAVARSPGAPSLAFWLVVLQTSRMRDTYEYGYLHILIVDGLPGKDGEVLENQLVAIVQTQGTRTIEGAEPGADNSLLRIVNQLGQDGWIIPAAELIKVENNQTPSALRDALQAHFGRWGIIRFRSERWITRRISWPE